MATHNLTLEQVEDLFENTVRKILKIPEEDNCSIRFPYGSDPESEDDEAPGAAPDFERTDNVCFIYVFPDEDGYGTQTHYSYRDDGVEKLTEIDEHTEVYRLNFMCYGPKAAQWVKELRRGLVRQEIREHLQRSRFHLVSQSLRATRIPEQHEGAWWNRWDLAAYFYAHVCIETENIIGIIETVPINPITERST